jgi:apoptosis-inducing factor 2
MSETRNIVVLGASAAGLSAAHYLCKHTLPKLKAAKDAKYELHLVDPSTHFWWHIAAPREIVSVKDMPHSKCFVPNMDGFKQYSDLKDSIHFHQGTASGLDVDSRKVLIKTHGGSEESLPYYALVIATGIRSPTPLTTLQGEHTISIQALDSMNEKLRTAKDIVISGGGPVGVETAGEIGSYLSGKKANITLIAGAKKLLPMLNDSRASKAQRMLEKVGVTVMYNVKTTGSTETADGKQEIQLDNGKTMTADVFIPAYGVTPNTEFLPENLRSKGGYVAANPKTLRVDAAGPRVYAAGDVAGVDAGGMLKLYASLPVVGANISHDLLEDAKVGTFAERTYMRKDDETQLVPIGMKTGIGAFNGWSMPGFVIAQVKGKQYFTNTMADITEGKKWTKA